MSVERPNFTLVIFKAACHAKPGALKNELDEFPIF